jgi:hypothetical protein
MSAPLKRAGRRHDTEEREGHRLHVTLRFGLHTT